MFATRLRKIDGVPKHVFDLVGHRIQIAFGGRHPFDRFARLFEHLADYANLGMVLSTTTRHNDTTHRTWGNLTCISAVEL